MGKLKEKIKQRLAPQQKLESIITEDAPQQKLESIITEDAPQQKLESIITEDAQFPRNAYNTTVQAGNPNIWPYPPVEPSLGRIGDTVVPLPPNATNQSDAVDYIMRQHGEETAQAKQSAFNRRMMEKLKAARLLLQQAQPKE